MEHEPANTQHAKKKKRAIDREGNTALYLLRAKQTGLLLSELDMISIGMVYDMLTESANDEYDYPQKATQEDMNRL